MRRLVTTASFATALLAAALGAAGQAAAAPAGVTLQPTTTAATDVNGSVGPELGFGLYALTYTPSGQALTCGNGGIGVGGVPSTALCPIVMDLSRALESGS